MTIIYFLNNFEFGMFVQQKYINIHLPTKWTLVNGFEWQLWWLQWMPPPLTKVSLKLHSLNGLNKVTHCTYSANSEAVWPKVGIKSSPTVSKSCLKSSTAVSSYTKSPKNSPKNWSKLWATFVRYFVTEIFKK